MTNDIRVSFCANLFWKQYQSKLILKDPKTWTRKAVISVKALLKCQIVLCNLIVKEVQDIKNPRNILDNHCLDKNIRKSKTELLPCMLSCLQVNNFLASWITTCRYSSFITRIWKYLMSFISKKGKINDI